MTHLSKSVRRRRAKKLVLALCFVVHLDLTLQMLSDNRRMEPSAQPRLVVRPLVVRHSTDTVHATDTGGGYTRVGSPMLWTVSRMW